ncbi:MAG: HD domain-containing protein [Candidatus Nanohaloarchaea archaeon]
MDLDAIREDARQYFEDVSPSHDWHHVERMKALAERLASEEGADLETVRLAALLHDIGRGKEDRGEIDDHAEWGAEEAGDILERHGASPGTIEDVKHCIRSHRYSNDIEPDTVEAEVVSDADNLDALGATGIARTFCYGGEHGKVMADPDLPVEEDGSEAGKTSLNHLHKKILSLKERMYTDSGRELAEDRHEYVRRFVERFEDEMEGRR